MSVKQTFWQLLDCYDIEIPIIQRDYAQGRSDAKAKQIRQGFVQSLYLMVTEPAASQNLDFIYGSIKNESLILLDGQQRLTTLFLLHWYIATGAEQADNACCKLGKFRYETRVSSREFTEALLRFSDEFNLLEIKKNLSEIIKDAHWFFSIWANDPTVQSMLTMLDEIHRVFKPVLENSRVLWDKLICNENPPITFHFLNMDDFSLTDELYIKMNARGRPLTEFENFKAWLQNYADLNTNFWHSMDKEWTDVFWGLRDKGVYEIDDEFLRFFKSVALANAARTMELPSNKLLDVDGDLIDKLRSDSYIPVQVYIDHDCFVSERLKQLSCFLNFVHNSVLLNSGERNFNLLNLCRTIFADVLKKKGYLEQVRFYAFFIFVAEIEGEESWNEELFVQMEDWLSITLKLINNTSFDSSADYVRAIHSLTNLRKLLPGDIYKCFSLIEAKSIRFFNEQQRKEEVDKAKLIVDKPEWKPVLKQYEEHDYFYGQIGFLLDASKNQETTEYDIDRFINIANKASKLFSDGLIETEDFLLQRALLAVGDYTIKVGYSGNYGFCRSVKGNARDRNDNWRQVFNDKGKRQKILIQLIDELEEGNEINGLNKVLINRDTKGWREFFILYPKLIGCCEKRLVKFDYDDSDEIYLLNGVKKASRDRGLRTYSLYLEIRDSKAPKLNGLKEKLQPYWNYCSDEEAPAVIFSPWQGGELQVVYDDGFKYALVDTNGDEFPIKDCDDLLILKNMFSILEGLEE